MKVEDKQANNFRNPPEDTSVNYVKQPHLQKATIVVVVAETTSRKNVDSNMSDCRNCNSKGHIAKVCAMELDTGASVSIMSEEAWRKRFATAQLEESQIKLRTYTGEALDIIG